MSFSRRARYVNAKGRTRVACVVACVAIGVACNGTTGGDAGGLDASVPPDAGGGGGRDARPPDVDGGCYGEGDCPAFVTMMDIAEINPPKDGTQGSCTDAELAKVTGKFADILAAVSPTCASCLFTEATDGKNTQFFVWADTMHVNVSLENFGACMGSPLSGGSPECGKAAEELFSCLQAAVPLNASGAPVCCEVPLQELLNAVLQGDCKVYDQKQTAACGGVANVQAIKSNCFDTQPGYDPSLVPGVNPGLKLLCGGSAVDAGADGGPADAGDGG